MFIFLLLTLRQISLALLTFSSIDLLSKLALEFRLELSLSLLAVMMDYEDVRLIAFCSLRYGRKGEKLLVGCMDD